MKWNVLFRIVSLVGLIVIIILLSVQIYHPMDCEVIFLDFDIPGNVTITHADGYRERWTTGDPAIYGSRAKGADGMFIKPDSDKVWIEHTTAFTVKCLRTEEDYKDVYENNKR